jgi:hypothetical protein
MTNYQTLKISGMLNQHEFNQRYIFTMQRIASGFSRHELAFLLGRTTYDIADYEQLCEQAKLSFRNYEAMAALFKNPAPIPLAFNSKVNDTDISNEKRMIRGTVTETNKERQIQFIHPWKIKGESKPVIIVEGIERVADKDLKILQWVYDHLAKLKTIGCFERGCTALFLHQQMNSTIVAEWKPLFVTILRQVVYAHVHSSEFQIHYEDGQVLYKIKK